MRILSPVLVFALLLPASGRAQPPEKRTTETAAETTVPMRKSKPAATWPAATNPYGALVQNASRSADEFRNDNTQHNQDRDHLESADNAQSVPAPGKKPPRAKPKKSPP